MKWHKLLVQACKAVDSQICLRVGRTISRLNYANFMAVIHEVAAAHTENALSTELLLAFEKSEYMMEHRPR